MSKPLDSFDLPPLQYAVLELVAARHRLGHDGWTVHSKCKSAVDALADKGLVGWKHGVVEKCLLVWLTELGQVAALSNDYVPPILGGDR